MRDVAWSPQIGDSTDVIASCGRVNTIELEYRIGQTSTRLDTKMG